MGPILPLVWTSPMLYRELEELLIVKANYANKSYKIYLAGVVLHP